MKKYITILIIILISVVLFLFIPALIDWVIKGIFEITIEKIRLAILLGIFTPSAILISRRIKNDVVFVLIAILVLVISIIILRF